jgi:hypothetical protein
MQGGIQQKQQSTGADDDAQRDTQRAQYGWRQGPLLMRELDPKRIIALGKSRSQGSGFHVLKAAVSGEHDGLS